MFVRVLLQVFAEHNKMKVIWCAVGTNDGHPLCAVGTLMY
jgi:hypothetical protein